MSTEKDSMLRVRLTQRQSDELDAIIDELQAQMPEAKRYHIKHSKIRSGEVCERPYREA